MTEYTLLHWIVEVTNDGWRQWHSSEQIRALLALLFVCVCFLCTVLCIFIDKREYQINIFFYFYTKTCGYSLGVPQRGTSNKSPQHVFIEKKILIFFFFFFNTLHGWLNFQQMTFWNIFLIPPAYKVCNGGIYPVIRSMQWGYIVFVFSVCVSVCQSVSLSINIDFVSKISQEQSYGLTNVKVYIQFTIWYATYSDLAL